MARPNELFGIIFIGLFFSLVVLGINVSQVYVYFNKHPSDSRRSKFLVVLLISLDFGASICNCWWLYDLFVKQWGSFSAFQTASWLVAIHPMFASTAAFIVQCFFAWKIFLFTRNKLLLVLVSILSLATVCGGLGTGIGILMLKEFSKFKLLGPPALIWLASASLCDIIITVILSYQLRKSRSMFAKTNKFINRVVGLTIQNGLLTTVFTIIDMVLHLTTRELYHIAFSLVIPKLYVNTALSSLNARFPRDENLAVIDPESLEFTISTSTASQRHNGLRVEQRTGHQEVFVNVDTGCRNRDSETGGENKVLEWNVVQGVQGTQ